MLKISEATAIALHAMVYIAHRENESSTVKDISERFNISENHLSKVLQRLVKGGYLISIKGPKGGFSIVPEHKYASFLEIYTLIEGKPKEHTCLFNSNPNHCQKCIMSNLVDKLKKEFIEYLETNNISDFAL